MSDAMLLAKQLDSAHTVRDKPSMHILHIEIKTLSVHIYIIIIKLQDVITPRACRCC